MSTGSHVLKNFAKGRYVGVCLKRSLNSYKLHKLWPHPCLMGWGGLGRERKGEGSLKMTSMCSGSCNLDVTLPLPASPLGRSLKDWGKGESMDPSKTVTIKFGDRQRGRAPTEEGMTQH